jgi:hypothetical protein
MMQPRERRPGNRHLAARVLQCTDSVCEQLPGPESWQGFPVKANPLGERSGRV